MEKVLDYKTISRQIMACMRPGMVTNSTLSGETLRQKIESGTLWVHSYPGGLLLFEKKAHYWLLRYYIVKPEIVPDFFPDEAVLCESVYKPGQKILPSLWWEDCFTAVCTRLRMERAASDADDAVLSSALDGQALREFLLNCFSEETGCIPSAEELSLAAKDGRILTKIHDGKVAAVLHAEKRKGYTELRHLAVLAECRGCGLAKSLTERFVRIFGADTLRVWVRGDEQTARHIYEQNGFIPDGYTAIVWKKKG